MCTASPLWPGAELSRRGRHCHAALNDSSCSALAHLFALTFIAMVRWISIRAVDLAAAHSVRDHRMKASTNWDLTADFFGKTNTRGRNITRRYQFAGGTIMRFRICR